MNYRQSTSKYTEHDTVLGRQPSAFNLHPSETGSEMIPDLQINY